MMPIRPFFWDLAVFALLLAAFFCLALASERAGNVLLGHNATAGQKRLLRLAGWLLLVLGLLLCIKGWHGNFGPFLWFGWMTLATLTVVFFVSYWPWREQSHVRSPRAAAAPVISIQNPPRWLRVWRSLGCLILIGLPLGVGWALYQTPPRPLLRADAVQGQVGPWSFVLAEEDFGEPPEATSSGVLVKHLILRFCNECDAEIRTAYVQLRRPVLSKARGLMFQGDRWEREASLIVPPAATPQDQIWLTVIGKDGTEYQKSLELARVSPKTAKFIREKAL